MGRPSKYLTQIKDKLYMVEAWARAGLSNEQIAENMGVTVTTLYDWKLKYLDFSEALKGNKAIADREVENSLFKACNGYEVEEVTTERKQKVNAEGELVFRTNKNGMQIPIFEMVETSRTRKMIAPNPTSIKFFLTNRKPDEWKERKEVGITLDKRLENFFDQPETLAGEQE